MVILDTNVISETSREHADPTVNAWFSRQKPRALFLTAPSVGEMAAGVEQLPPGRRRVGVAFWLQAVLEDFEGRILSFEVESARHYGRLIATSRALGRPAGVTDAQIAAVAVQHGMTVATRDIEQFEPFGIPLINPWTDD